MSEKSPLPEAAASTDQPPGSKPSGVNLPIRPKGPGGASSSEDTSNEASRWRSQVDSLTHQLADLKAKLEQTDRLIASKDRENAAKEKYAAKVKAEVESTMMDEFSRLHERGRTLVGQNLALNKLHANLKVLDATLDAREATVKKLINELKNGDVSFENAISAIREDVELEFRAQDDTVAAKAEKALSTQIERLKSIDEPLYEYVHDHTRPRTLADSRHAPQPASRESQALDEAAKRQIFNDGYDAGYLDYAMTVQLKLAANGKVKGPDGTVVTIPPEKTAYLRDTNHRKHPYQIGMRVAKTACWSILCDHHNRPDLDERIFKRRWTVEMISPLDYHFAPNSFWDGVHKVSLPSKQEFEKRLLEGGKEAATARQTGTASASRPTAAQEQPAATQPQAGSASRPNPAGPAKGKRVGPGNGGAGQ